MKPKETSQVVQVLTLIWQGTNTVTPHSWERLNHAMYKALQLCIGAGLPFTAEDWKAAYDDFRACRWIGDPERLYAFAVSEGNEAAAVAYEALKGRHPFIADDVTPADCHGGFAHLIGKRQRERLHVGSSFPWKGERVTVTSFAKDGRSLTACSYHSSPRHHTGPRTKKKYRITRQDILADRAERKERAKLLKQLGDLAKTPKASAKVKKLLGAETQAEFDALPLETIRNVLNNLTKEKAA